MSVVMRGSLAEGIPCELAVVMQFERAAGCYATSFCVCLKCARGTQSKVRNKRCDECHTFKFVFINATRDQLGNLRRSKRRELLYLFDYVGAIFSKLTQK
jgi:hypothetical protein